jgi:hypothetical protein
MHNLADQFLGVLFMLLHEQTTPYGSIHICPSFLFFSTVEHQLTLVQEQSKVIAGRFCATLT